MSLVVRREGRIQRRTLMSFCMGFLDKAKAPLFLPLPRTRSFSDLDEKLGTWGISLAGSDWKDNFG